MNDRNTTDCWLIALVDWSSPWLSINIYKDQFYIQKVARGDASSSGTITLSQENSSGLSGSVSWDGDGLSPHAQGRITLTC